MYVYELTTWTDTTPKVKTRGRNTYEDGYAARRAMMAAVARTDKVAGLYASGRIFQIDENGEELA